MADQRPERIVLSEAFFDALRASDVFRDGERVRRVVIDARAGEAVLIYVERFGDRRIVDVAPALAGIQVREVDRD